MKGISSTTSVQLAAVPAHRGRVMALYLMAYIEGAPFGSPIIGWVGVAYGPGWTFVGGAACTVAGTLLAAAASGCAVRREPPG